ncbi:MAG TPA: 3'(2'),5'-bisphosphate nucleotidase CysQ [Mycobacteriales bacterium]|nr:3'(2'),5'-bisphosphate nucleotidase CysQ [Mycobacteriales bacterium]
MSAGDAALAARLATEAGELLLKVRQSVEPERRKDEGDRQSHEFLAAALASERPGDAVLSEEGKDSPARLSADRVWIIDPLDGTREFGEGDRRDWAVHVALWSQGSLVAGAVALPAQGVTFSSDEPPTLPELGDPIRLVVSRTRPPELVTALAEVLGAELVPMGSAGAKAMSVLQGASDAYVHGGGQYEWDSAAPVVVATAAGLHTSRLDGSPLVYNQEDVLLPDLVVCQPSIAARLLEAIAAV